jgi:hypothetical protein
MRAMPPGYVRKGRPCYFQIDHDAWALLQHLAPTNKSYGRYLSELIRRDYALRQQWEQGRAGVPELVEVHDE